MNQVLPILLIITISSLIISLGLTKLSFKDESSTVKALLNFFLIVAFFLFMLCAGLTFNMIR